MLHIGWEGFQVRIYLAVSIIINTIILFFFIFGIICSMMFFFADAI